MGDYIFKHDESIILLHNGILRAEELCTLNISFHRTHRPLPHRPHHPSPPPPPRLLAGVTTLPVNKSFPAQVTFGMFNLREVQMCSAKSRRPFCLWVLWSSWRCRVFFFFWKERKSDAGKPQTQNKSHLFSLFLQLISLNTYLLWLQRQSIKTQRAKLTTS